MNIYGVDVKCDPTDELWIKETISKLPHRHLIAGVLNKYNLVIQSAEYGNLRQEGAARRAANSKLRIYVKKSLEAQG